MLHSEFQELFRHFLFAGDHLQQMARPLPLTFQIICALSNYSVAFILVFLSDVSFDKRSSKVS